jgi:flagellar biosynthesis GTPase FlhF
MKKILLLFLVLTGAAIAQTESEPILTTKEPSFMGFTGSFMRFGSTFKSASGSNRSFTMPVEYRPWFFELSGVAYAERHTEDLDILDNITVVVAYYDALGKAIDGVAYQAGIFDFMVYIDDEPIKVTNMKITLKGRAAPGAATLEQAKTWNFEPGKVFKNPKYSNDITKAQARAVDKSDVAKEEAAAKKEQAKEKKRIEDSIAKEKKRVQDSIAKAEAQRKEERRKAMRDRIEGKNR